MKRIISVLAIMCLMHTASARSFYDQLCDFNYNWKKYEDRAPFGEERRFLSDQEYVNAHLTNVLVILKENPTSHLTTQQVLTRRYLIEVLDGYRKAGRFPMNYYRNERIPVFIDEHGTHCAVGFLLQQTGNQVVANRIAEKNNYAWVKEIDDPAIPGWIEWSGFTLEEVKLIQGAYDSYLPYAFEAPNKYELPQKPEVIAAYFEDEFTGKPLKAKPEHIWLYGEGSNGILNGKWIQNYAVGIPWIVGYYQNGKRTGQWKEYYQGTTILCRTEVWRNDELNGVRKRFDRSGNLIEEITFKNGDAVLKVNYDLLDSIKFIRKPLPDGELRTQVFTFGGELLAEGNERIHNPGNLLWFQNIELTALNSASITSLNASQSYEGFVPGATHSQVNSLFMPQPIYGVELFSSPPLVQYIKEGQWKYYKQFNRAHPGSYATNSMVEMLDRDYFYYSWEIHQAMRLIEDHTIQQGFDSIQVDYNGGQHTSLKGYGEKDFVHLEINYHDLFEADHPEGLSIHEYDLFGYVDHAPQKTIESTGRYNQEGLKVGIWNFYNRKNQLYKTENYLIPTLGDGELVGSRD